MFLSDNNSGVHPKIIQAISFVNGKGHDFPYGNDSLTKDLEKKIKEIFQSDTTELFLTATGTSANAVAIASVLHSYEAVICTDTAHINTNECGAFEKLTGSKILPAKNKNGKLIISDAKVYLKQLGDVHRVQPRVLSISQLTELGTVYFIDEIKKVVDFAHENDLLIHVDGARIANAAVSLNCSLSEMITNTEVDLLSFGGTKNGMMFGEAVISFNKKASKKLPFMRKQFGYLFSKMRFVSAQFLAYLEKDLWRQNASNANNTAKYLEENIKDIRGVEIIYPVDANMIFAKLPGWVIPDLAKKYHFYVMDKEQNIIRLVTSFDTKKEEIDAFVDAIKKLT